MKLKKFGKIGKITSSRVIYEMLMVKLNKEKDIEIIIK